MPILLIAVDLDDTPYTSRGITVDVVNATEDLKQISDHIAPSNDDEGLAWAVEHLACSS